MKEAAVNPDDKGGPKVETTSSGGGHQNQPYRAGDKVGSPQPVVDAPQPVVAEQPDGSQQEVPLAQQAPPPLPGMPENSSATPGFEDTQPDPSKEAQAEEERKRSEQP